MLGIIIDNLKHNGWINFDFTNFPAVTVLWVVVLKIRAFNFSQKKKNKRNNIDIKIK